MIDRPYVVGCMERWAKWCHGSVGGGISLTGRFIQGVRSNICPVWLDDVTNRRNHDPYCALCGGTGRVRLMDVTSTKTRTCQVCKGTKVFAGKDCFFCRGVGKVTVRRLSVNPAGIKQTRNVGGQLPSDAVSALIDDQVSKWRETDGEFWLARIAVAEYHHNGTQAMKAIRMKVSTSFYEKTLRKALTLMEKMLGEKMPKDGLTCTDI